MSDITTPPYAEAQAGYAGGKCPGENSLQTPARHPRQPPVNPAFRVCERKAIRLKPDEKPLLQKILIPGKRIRALMRGRMLVCIVLGLLAVTPALAPAAERAGETPAGTPGMGRKREWCELVSKYLNSVSSSRCGGNNMRPLLHGNERIYKYISILLTGFFILSVMPVEVKASNVSLTASFPTEYGISFDMGFDMQYSPSNVWTKSGDSASVSYTPTPMPATIIINIPSLLSALGYGNYASYIPNDYQTWSKPIASTPLGMEELGEWTIFTVSGLSLVLNFTFNTQLVGSVVTDKGQLDKTSFQWTSFKAETINLDTQGVTSDAIIQAKDFSYTLDVIVSGNFHIPIIGDINLVSGNFALGSQSLVGTTITNVKIFTDVSNSDNENNNIVSGLNVFDLIIGLTIGIIVGTIIGLVVSKSKNAKFTRKEAATQPKTIEQLSSKATATQSLQPEKKPPDDEIDKRIVELRNLKQSGYLSDEEYKRKMEELLKEV